MGYLSNSKHEQFAQLCAEGMSAAQAYLKSHPKSSAVSAETNGPALARTNQVSIRVAELRKEASDASSLTRAGMVQWLERIIKAKPSEASDESDICETVMTKMGPFTQLCPKMGAAEKLIKMAGWNSPEEVKHSGSVGIEVLSEAVAKVFGK